MFVWIHVLVSMQFKGGREEDKEEREPCEEGEGKEDELGSWPRFSFTRV